MISAAAGVPATSAGVVEAAPTVLALPAPAAVELKRAEARPGREWMAGRREEFKGDIEPALSGSLAVPVAKDES